MSIKDFEFISRYGDLFPVPDPATMCRGQCEGTGWYPVALYLHPPREGEVRPAYPDPLTPYEEAEWRKAEAAHPNQPGDDWHFIRCPDCQGTGKRAEGTGGGE